MRIQHNIMAMNSYRNLGTNNTALSKNLEKLSSGYRINRAGDDAAGLAISEKMRAQIAGLDQAQNNAQSGINLVKTAEGALTEVHDMLNRMVTLATQSANGTYDGADRSKIQDEVNALIDEIDRIADNSNFNGTKLLNGELDTTTTYAFEGESSATEAAIDFEISINQYDTDGNGEMGNDITVSLDTTTGTESAEFDDSGALTIKLKTGTSYTASDIQALLAKATSAGFGTGALDVAMKDAMTEAVQGANVFGVGVTAEKYHTDLAAAGTTSTPEAPSGDTLTLQIGADAVEAIDVSVETMSAKALGVEDLSIGTVEDANKAIDTIKTAIEKVSTTRGKLGAVQNRLEHTINNLGVMEENIQDAESVIRDTDVAEEMMAYTKNNILIQSAQAMLAQANQVPQGVLQLMQ